MSVVAQEVLRSADLAVRAVTGFSRDCCFVTFDSYTDLRSLDRSGFGEKFFRDQQIDAIHVLARENDWYQNAEFPDACQGVAELTREYRRVVAYGSSMGGYAAIRFGRRVGASVAFALSPQFSIDPDRVPFENRWNQDSARIAFVNECDVSQFVGSAIVAYDPYNVDARHVELFRAHTRIIDIALPNSGHPCTGYLAELGLLQEAVIAIASNAFDPIDFQRRARRRRKEAGQFYSTLSYRARSDTLRLALARRAVDRSPESIQMLGNLAVMAARVGSLDDALATLKRIFMIAPDHPVALYQSSEVFEIAGDIERAISIMEDLCLTYAEAGVYQPRLDYLREKRKAVGWLRGAAMTKTKTGRDLQLPVSTAKHPAWQTAAAALARGLRSRAAALFTAGAIDFGTPRHPRPEIDRRPVDIRVTTRASPPPFVTSWQRHDQLLRQLPDGRVDLILVGDSLAEYWPAATWAPLQVFNFGIAADKTQHAIWRIEQLTGELSAARALVVLGTNNLGAGDTPEGIVAGIREVVRRLVLVLPDADITVLEVPPCGPGFDFRGDDRKHVNRLLRDASWARTINVDDAMTQQFSETSPNYMADNIHFSPAGYETLTALVRTAWK